MNRYFNREWSAIWFWGILAICCALVVITLFQFEVRASTGIVQFLSRFVLTEENNFGAWWSGLLLFVIGIHAFDGYQLYRLHQPDAARGWLLISIIMIILSADEVSSLHERANALLHLGKMLSLLPFGIILSTMLGYAIISLWSAEEHRARAGLICLGFFFFGTVAVQEYLEVKNLIDWGQLVTLRGAIEEGVELLAMMVLLAVSIGNTRGIFARKGAGAYPAFEIVGPISLPGLAIGLIAASLIGYTTSRLPDLSRGHPADWFSATVFLLASLAAASRFIRYRENIGVLKWAMTGLCLVASASFVAVSPEGTIRVASIDVNARMLLFLAVSALTCAIWALSYKNDAGVYIPAIVAIVGIALFSVFRTSLLSWFVLPTYLGFLVYYVNSTQLIKVVHPQIQSNILARLSEASALVVIDSDPTVAARDQLETPAPLGTGAYLSGSQRNSRSKTLIF
ncbi:MAG TPA: hypothetical protein VFR55_11295 [Dehalococcoidia bacterium]|nr:hypothetical protein [Dehalococcoidia bacterium]